MSYLIAAYVVVLGSLFAYGLWLARQRRHAVREQLAEAQRTAADRGRDDPSA